MAGLLANMLAWIFDPIVAIAVVLVGALIKRYWLMAVTQVGFAIAWATILSLALEPQRAQHNGKWFVAFAISSVLFGSTVWLIARAVRRRRVSSA